MEPVRLSSIESIRRFHSFIFANPTSRAPHIYGLFVFNPDWSYGPNDNPLPANYLAAILEAATSLQFLSCATGFGHPVCRAVAKMTTLRELSVSSDWGSRARQPHPKALNILLTALRSPLQSLSINSYEEGQISASFFHDHLSHFAPTLESLKLQDFSFDISPSSVTTPFAALRSLKISSASYRPHCYKLDVLLRLFPNLDDTFFLSGSRVPTDQYSVLRQRSKETQKDHTWPGLDRVIYSANFAFLMALQCPIRCMDIDKSLFDEFDDHDGPALEDASYLAEALRDNCPQRLSVPLIFSCRDCLRGLDGLFPPAGMDNLTHLVVFAEIQISRTWRDRQTGRRTRFAWSQLLDALVDSVKHRLPRLTHLRVVFYYDIDGVYKQSFKTIAHEEDLLPAAMRLLDAIRTLRYLFLVTCGQREPSSETWYSAKAWRVAVGKSVDENSADMHSGSHAATPRGAYVEMGEEEAEEIVFREKLYSYDRENAICECFVDTSDGEGSE